jgi:hypothetical protein
MRYAADTMIRNGIGSLKGEDALVEPSGLSQRNGGSAELMTGTIRRRGSSALSAVYDS